MEENKKPMGGSSTPEWTPQNSKSDNGSKRLKLTVIILAVVAVVLAAVFAYVWIDRQKMINDLTVDKQNLTNELVELQGEYAQLSSNNDSLNVQLDREREKVDQLLDRIKKTDAANRSKIRQYEKELGTLRSIMKHYIFQIDSLNTLNIALRKDAELARAEAAKSAERYQELSKTTDEYAKLVEQGSEIKGRGINIVGIMHLLRFRAVHQGRLHRRGLHLVRSAGHRRHTAEIASVSVHGILRLSCDDIHPLPLL